MFHTVKKEYLLAIVSFLFIPIVLISGSRLFSFINPEIAAGYPNYERNYWLLDAAKNFCVVSALLISMGLWFLTCLYLIKSKKQSYVWLSLALLGPFGFIGLTALGDRAPLPGDFYRRTVGRMTIYLRVPFELGFLVVVWVVAYRIIVLKRDLSIMYEAITTGTSIEKIINQQSASGGMWAFGEGLEEVYLVVLLYLLWPICFNAVGHLPKL